MVGTPVPKATNSSIIIILVEVADPLGATIADAPVAEELSMLFNLNPVLANPYPKFKKGVPGQAVAYALLAVRDPKVHVVDVPEYTIII